MHEDFLHSYEDHHELQCDSFPTLGFNSNFQLNYLYKALVHVYAPCMSGPSTRTRQKVILWFKTILIGLRGITQFFFF